MHYYQIMEQWIATYGYWVILVGTILEGETVVLIAGYLAHQGYLNLIMVMGFSAVGAIIGDHLYFVLGRWKGERLLLRHPRWRARGDCVLTRLERHQNLVMLSFRYFYGLRTITPFMLGMTGVSLPRFSAFNVSGAAFWAVVVSVLGFVFGKGVETVIERAHRFEWIIVGLIAGLAGLVWLIRTIRGIRNPTLSGERDEKGESHEPSGE